ncbi:MAG: type II secretion system protein N [Desulfocapsaceae bacterium]|nr:type II secretion system protein N [Desulfocapsaceae bacterium]
MLITDKMLKSLLRILPFIVITLGIFGLVEVFYGLMDHYMFSPRQETKVTVPSERIAVQIGDGPEKYSDYSVISRRNLFASLVEENQPEEPTEEDPFAGIEATELELVLMGTVTGQEGGDRAIILKKRDNKQEIFYQGDVIEGALIKTIDRGRIILEYQGNDEVLDMSEASSIRRSQVAAEVRAAPQPAPMQRRVIQGSAAQQQQQQPRRRIISPGNQNIMPGTDIPPTEEGFAGEQQEGMDMETEPVEEIIDQEVVPGEGMQQ